jgi:CobQ-like glutamine amidotransferase family enzyme
MKGIGLWAAIEDDMPVLAVCGGYQLLAHYYRPATGSDMRGLGVFDAWTIHKGSRVPRSIGDIAIRWNGTTLVGFENHGGRTYLGSAQPLGKVLKGHGNNSEDGTEGAIYRNAYGTYLHGSLLPKNPHFADHLIRLALHRKYGTNHWTDIANLDTIEMTGDYAQANTGGPVPESGTALPDPLAALTMLDDSLEWEAHAFLLERLGLHNAARAALQQTHHT